MSNFIHSINTIYSNEDLPGEIFCKPLKAYHGFFVTKITECPNLLQKCALRAAHVATGIFAYPLLSLGVVCKLVCIALERAAASVENPEENQGEVHSEPDTALEDVEVDSTIPQEVREHNARVVDKLKTLICGLWSHNTHTEVTFELNGMPEGVEGVPIIQSRGGASISKRNCATLTVMRQEQGSLALEDSIRNARGKVYGNLTFKLLGSGAWELIKIEGELCQYPLG